MTDVSRELLLVLKAENAQLRAKLAESTAELEKFRTGTTGAAAGAAKLGQDAAAATAGLGGMAGALSGALGPLALVSAGVALFAEGSRELKARGVDVATTGDLIDKVWTGVSVALGGTSEAALEAERGLAAMQRRTKETDVTQRQFASGLDLVAAAGIDVNQFLENAAPAFRTFTEQIESGIPALDNAGKGLHDFNVALNEVRLTMPGVAEELAAKFIELGKRVQEGDQEAIASLRELNEHVQELGDRSRAVVDRIKKDYGDDAPRAFGEFTGAAATAVPAFEQLTAGGVTGAAAYAMLKKEFAATVEGAQRFAKEIPNLDAGLQANIGVAEKVHAQYGSIEVALDKVRAKWIESGKTINEINDAIAEGTTRLGSRAAAIRAVEPAIDALTKHIEKQRDAEGQLDATNQSLLDALLKWKAEIGHTTPEVDKLTKAIEDQEKKVSGLVDRIQDKIRAYNDSAAAVERHRVTTVRAAQEEFDAVRKSTVDQTIALNAQHAARLISEEEYLAEFNRIQAEEIEARRKHEAEIVTINQEAHDKTVDLQKKLQEQTAEIEKVLAAEGQSFRNALGVHSSYERSLRDKLIPALADHSRAESESRTAVDVLGIGFEGLASKSIPGVRTELQRLAGDARTAAAAIRDIKKAADEAFPVVSGGHTSVGVPEERF
jgi:ABC-type transporter Mla subunit MlaD